MKMESWNFTVTKVSYRKKQIPIQQEFVTRKNVRVCPIIGLFVGVFAAVLRWFLGLTKNSEGRNQGGKTGISGVWKGKMTDEPGALKDTYS